MQNKELRTKTAISEAGKAKRSRVRYACKPSLQALFDTLNLIPPDQVMDTPYLEGTRRIFRPDSREWVEDERRKYEAFQEYLKNFHPAFQAFIYTPTMNETDRFFRELDDHLEGMDEAGELAQWKRLIAIWDKQIMLYERMRAIRKDLYLLAEIGQNPERYFGQQLDIALSVLFVEYAYLDKEGRLRRQPNPYAELMEGVEVSRIRACLICRKLFWANRRDKKCCSDEHSAIIRQRQSRLNKEKNAKLYAKSAKVRKLRQKSGAGTFRKKAG